MRLFLLFILSIQGYFFHQDQNVPQNSKPETASAFEANQVYITDEHVLYKREHGTFVKVLDLPATSEKWFYTLSGEGRLIGAKQAFDGLYSLNDAVEWELMPVDFLEVETISRVLDLTIHNDVISILGFADVSGVHTLSVDLNDLSATFNPNAGVSVGSFASGTLTSGIAFSPINGEPVLNQFSIYGSGHVDSDIVSYRESSLLSFQLEGSLSRERLLDISFDAYGELYGITNTQLYYIDMDARRFIPTVTDPEFLQSNLIINVEEPADYGIGPKTYSIGKLQPGEVFTGQIKVRNHSDDPLRIDEITSVDTNLIFGEIPMEPLMAGEYAYITFEVNATAPQTISAYAKLNLSRTEQVIADSVLIQGLYHQPLPLAAGDLYRYGGDNQILQSFENEEGLILPHNFQTMAATPSGQVYGIAGSSLYTIDPNVGKTTLVADLAPFRSDLSERSFYDMAFMDDSHFILLNTSGGFRREYTNQFSIYQIRNDSIISIDRIALPSGRVRNFAYSRTRHQINYVITNDFQSFNSEGTLYTVNLINKEVTTMDAAIENYQVLDLFFDHNDQLKGFFRNSPNEVYIGNLDSESGELRLGNSFEGSLGIIGIPSRIQLGQTPPSSIAGGQSSLIYPNPVSQFFRVNTERSVIKMQLHDLSGREIAFGDVEADQSDIYSLEGLDIEPGTYIVRLFFEDGTENAHRIYFRP